MVHVGVLGGTGFIGPAVVAAVHDMGHAATAISRSTAPVSADRSDPSSVAAAVRALGCTHLVDIIAYDGPSTRALMQALDGLIERYCVASSADVYQAFGAIHRKEPPPPPGLITEMSPVRTRPYLYRADPPRATDDPQAWLDRYEKLHVEAEALAHTAAIIRLPMVFGPRDRRSRFDWITAPMRTGAQTIAAPQAWLDFCSTYSPVEDAGRALALAALHPAAAGRIFHVGLEPVSHRVWIERFAALTGWAGQVETTESGPIQDQIAGLDLSGGLCLDSSLIRQVIGFEPRTDLTATLSRLLD